MYNNELIDHLGDGRRTRSKSAKERVRMREELYNPVAIAVSKADLVLVSNGNGTVRTYFLNGSVTSEIDQRRFNEPDALAPAARRLGK